MKKILFSTTVLVLLMFFLNACNEIEPTSDVIKVPEQKMEANTVKPEETHVEEDFVEHIEEVDGFSIKDEYLLLNGEKLIQVNEAFGFDDDPYFFRIWNVLEHENKNYIFLESIRECGGCINLSPKYLIYDPQTQNFEAKELTNTQNRLFNDLGVENLGVLSPDEQKIAYVETNNTDWGGPIENSSIWIFNLFEDTNTKVMDIPEGKTVLRQNELGSDLIEGTIKWDENSKNITVNLQDSNENGMILLFELFAESETGVNPWHEGNSVLSLDFEGDGIDEKVFIYEKNDHISEGEYRKNQHIKVYKLKEGEWKLIKEDTVGLEKMAVDNLPAEVEIINLGNDSKEELYVTKSILGSEFKYYIFGYENGEYMDLLIPKGYLHKDEYLKDGEAGMTQMWIIVDETGIKEHYYVYCEGVRFSEVDRYSDDVVCRQFDLFIKYEDGKFYPEVQE